ncbi:MAG: hypothetical protein ACRDUB_05175 [Mycobacterium sp.]
MIELSAQEQEIIMKTPIAFATPLLAVGLAAGFVALAPVGSTVTVAAPTNTTSWQQNTPISADTGAPAGDAKAGTDPLVPYGTETKAPVTTGFVDRNHDEGITTNGEVDLPF